jgi:hypothetical protein
MEYHSTILRIGMIAAGQSIDLRRKWPPETNIHNYTVMVFSELCIINANLVVAAYGRSEDQRS